VLSIDFLYELPLEDTFTVLSGSSAKSKAANFKSSVEYEDLFFDGEIRWFIIIHFLSPRLIIQSCFTPDALHNSRGYFYTFRIFVFSEDVKRLSTSESV